jgi:hypothetical protein
MRAIDDDVSLYAPTRLYQVARKILIIITTTIDTATTTITLDTSKGVDKTGREQGT